MTQENHPQPGPEQPGPGWGPPPPGYGPPPGWAPPVYGPPPGWAPPAGYGPPPGWGYRRPTNTTAILALVLAFVFAPAGLVLGVVARRQIRQTHEEGDGLALAGIIVGGLGTAVFVVLIVLWIVVVAAATQGSFGP